MRKWLAKFRTSLALDSRVPGREKLQQAQNRRDDVVCGEEALRALDQRLRATQPTTPVPAALHASVMRAVRTAAAQERRRAPGITRWLRWLPAPALAMLVVMGLWMLLNRPANEAPSLPDAATALEQSRQLAQMAPDVVLSPLTQEMNNLNRDLQNAVEFLAASVP